MLLILIILHQSPYYYAGKIWYTCSIYTKYHSQCEEMEVDLVIAMEVDLVIAMEVELAIAME